MICLLPTSPPSPPYRLHIFTLWVKVLNFGMILTGTSIPPVQAYGPHVSALGLKFYTGSQEEHICRKMYCFAIQKDISLCASAKLPAL